MALSDGPDEERRLDLSPALDRAARALYARFPARQQRTSLPADFAALDRATREVFAGDAAACIAAAMEEPER